MQVTKGVFTKSDCSSTALKKSGDGWFVVLEQFFLSIVGWIAFTGIMSNNPPEIAVKWVGEPIYATALINSNDHSLQHGWKRATHCSSLKLD